MRLAADLIFGICFSTATPKAALNENSGYLGQIAQLYQKGRRIANPERR
jgi:hypothetical protein